LDTLTNLEELNVNFSKIGDVDLSDLTMLKRLFLRGNKLSDKTLATLQGLTDLEVLDVAGPPAQLPSLEITDAGLKYLKGMTKLRSLWLYDTQVTEEGAAELKRTLPRVHIVR